MAENGEGQQPVILDMDSERTAPVSKHRRPSVEQLTEEQEQVLLEERAREDAMMGPSQEELNRRAEDREKLRSGMDDITAPYEALFARRAAELHATGDSKRIGGFLSPKYEVQDYTLDDEGERQYPFTLRYHVKKNSDGEKEYIPDSYTQPLVPISEVDMDSGFYRRYYKDFPDRKPPRLDIQFKNGAINELAILSHNIKTKDTLKERNLPTFMHLPLLSGGGNPKPQNLFVEVSREHPAIRISGVRGVTHRPSGNYKYVPVDQIYEMTDSGTFGPYPTKYKFPKGIEYDNDGKDWGLFSNGREKRRTMVPGTIDSSYKEDDFTAQKFLDLTQEILSLIPAKNLTQEGEDSQSLPDSDTKKELEQGRKREMPPKR